MGTTNPLSPEFLYSLYACALQHENICVLLVNNMRGEYLPDHTFQKIQNALSTHYRTYHEIPTYAVLSQIFVDDLEALELIDTFREYDQGQNSEVLIDLLEKYIKGVRLQAVYQDVGRLYNENKQEQAQHALTEYAKWVSEFTLKASQFVDVGATFEERFLENRKLDKEEELSKDSKVTRFYIPYLDSLNAGRNLRGQLTCILASTGVGKSHVAKWIGSRADIDDGLHVLHFQLEGSQAEALNAYSGALIGRNAFFYERGKISDREFAHYKQLVSSYAGNIQVRCYPLFNSQVSTLDIKNGIIDYRKFNGYNPDIVIVDSMDLLTDSQQRRWDSEHERMKRVTVAKELKDLATDENVWIVATYQSTIENRDWLNNENNVLTEYNCSEAKGLARPCTHLISLNQTAAEMSDSVMRLHIAKSRFFPKGDTIKVATNYDEEIFCDIQRTMSLNNNA